MVLYHVRAVDAIYLGSRYVARWVPAQQFPAACIVVDRSALADRPRITQTGLQVAPLLSTGFSQETSPTNFGGGPFSMRPQGVAELLARVPCPGRSAAQVGHARTVTKHAHASRGHGTRIPEHPQMASW